MWKCHGDVPGEDEIERIFARHRRARGVECDRGLLEEKGSALARFLGRLVDKGLGNFPGRLLALLLCCMRKEFHLQQYRTGCVACWTVANTTGELQICSSCLLCCLVHLLPRPAGELQTWCAQ